MLTQNTERRGALVSRVTSDVDQVSQFLVFGGLLFIVSVGQVLVATVVMVVYSWQLAARRLGRFAPLFLSLRYFQRKLSAAYGTVRRQVGVMLSAISEPVVGAAVVRSYAVEDRTQARIDDSDRRVQGRQHPRAGLHRVLLLARWCLGRARQRRRDRDRRAARLRRRHHLRRGAGVRVPGDVVRRPVQMGTQILTDAQNAIAGWRRVIGILETPADLVDPGERGQVLPHGPVDIRFEHVDFAYPDGPLVLRDVDLEIGTGTRLAIVGETGSGKSTFAKLLTRLMDPTSGTVRLDGIDLREIAQASLRRSVVLVPQEGFLFDDTLAANVRYGRLEATDDELLAAVEVLGLADWLATLPRGLDTKVGQRGESLSAGERQLVALLRAQLADPDLLVLDEATSAVDPALEMRIGLALERLMRGRTSVTIAHRLSTAENADEVVVVDRGRIVQRGPHAELVAPGGRVRRPARVAG